MFVHTDTPPPMGTMVRVTLETPDGEVELEAEVVHILDAETARSFGQSPGIGLQFRPVDGTKRRAIESYVDGLSRRLEPTPSLDDISGEEVRAAVRSFFEGYDNNDLYAAIGAGPLETSTVVERQLERLAKLFEDPPDSLTPPQLARVERAQRLLAKIGPLLRNPERRLEYDLRQGFVFAKERMEGRSRDQIQRMREVWQHIHPDRVREAEKHARTALEYESRREFEKAITAGKASLRFDPFNFALVTALEGWQAEAETVEKAPNPEDSVANSV